MVQPDIRTDIITEEEYAYNCMHYSEWAFFNPPDKFLFYQYDVTDKILICCYKYNDMFFVVDINGNFYGDYKSKNVSKYIKTKTWIIVESENFWDASTLPERINIMNDLTKAVSPWFVGLK